MAHSVTQPPWGEAFNLLDLVAASEALSPSQAATPATGASFYPRPTVASYSSQQEQKPVSLLDEEAAAEAEHQKELDAFYGAHSKTSWFHDSDDTALFGMIANTHDDESALGRILGRLRGGDGPEPVEHARSSTSSGSERKEAVKERSKKKKQTATAPSCSGGGASVLDGPIKSGR